MKEEHNERYSSSSYNFYFVVERYNHSSGYSVITYSNFNLDTVCLYTNMFGKSELDFIDSLLRSGENSNIIIAKAMINERQKNLGKLV